MNETQFKGLIDLYGADLSRWPEKETKAALAFMRQDLGAKRAFESEEKLEALLRQYAAVQTRLDLLEERIMAGLHETARPRRPSYPVYKYLSGGLLAALLLIVVFSGKPPGEPESALVETVLFAPVDIAMLDLEEEEFEYLYEITAF